MGLMNEVFRPLLDKCVVVYLDDILIYSRTWKDHLLHIEEVLKRLREHKLYCDKLGAPSLLTANSASAPGCRLVSAKVCGTNLHPTLLWVHVPAELGALPLPTSTSRRHDGSLEKGSLPLP